MESIWRLRKVNNSRWLGEDQNSKYHWINSEFTIFFSYRIPGAQGNSLKPKSRHRCRQRASGEALKFRLKEWKKESICVCFSLFLFSYFPNIRQSLQQQWWQKLQSNTNLQVSKLGGRTFLSYHRTCKSRRKRQNLPVLSCHLAQMQTQSQKGAGEQGS